MDAHEQGIAWLKLAARTKPKSKSREVCLRRAISHLENATESLYNTDQHLKSLRNLAITYWMLAAAVVGSRKQANTGHSDAVEAYTMALRYYAKFTDKKGQAITIHDNEYSQCLMEALGYCRSLPVTSAVTTMTRLLEVIPTKQSSYRFKCLLAMSDVVEDQAKKGRRNDDNSQVTGNAKEDWTKTMACSVQVTPDVASSKTDRLHSDLAPDELLSVLRRYQRPGDNECHLQEPSSLSPLGQLLELGRAKHYFESQTICGWLTQHWPGIQATIVAAIEQGFRKYRTIEYASPCLLDVQHIHRHNAYRLLCTLSAAYSIFTPYTPRFSLPAEQLMSYSRTRLALSKAIESIQKDQARVPDPDTDLYQIIELMVSVIGEAKCEFEATVLADRLSSSPLGALRRLATIWRPFQDLLSDNICLDKKELEELLLLRRAYNMAASHDAGNFILVLAKRLSSFETEHIANTCLLQLLKSYHDDPGQLLSLLYRAYPPKCSSSLITDEDALRRLSAKQLRSQIHLAMLCYNNLTSDVTSGSTRKRLAGQVRDILMLLRTQLMGRKHVT